MKKIENYSVIPESDLSEPIKILLVDDLSFARHFISKLIATVDRLKIIGTADNGQQAISLVESLQPDVVLIDLEMPEMDGVTATKIIVQRFSDCKVLVLSSHEDGSYVQKALKAGATGYLLKGSSATELTNAITSVHQGYTQLSPGLLEKVLTPPVEIVSHPEESTPATTSEQNWSESTREAIETLPRVSLRALLYLTIALTAIIVPWVTFTKVDEIGTARGKLEPQGKVFRLDAPVSGTVKAIEVKEGEKVTPGQSILKLESELVSSQLQQQQQKLQAQQNQLDRLRSLKNQQLLSLDTQKQQNQAQQFEKETLIAQAKENLASLKASYNNQLAEKQSQVAQARSAIDASKSAYKMAKIRAVKASEKVPRYREAYQQGALSQDLLSEAEQTALENIESIAQTQAEIAQAQSRYREQQQGYEKLRQQTTGEIEQAALRYQEQQRGYDSLVETNNLALLKIAEELKNTESQIAILEGEFAQTESSLEGLNYQLQQRIIYAPIKGVVFELPIAKPGAVVQPGQEIAQIAPENVPLVLRARISSAESGFLEVGLPVKLKFDAYPFQDYGVVPGRLTWVSPDSKIKTTETAESTDSAEFYELEIALEQNYIQYGERQILLTPGQTATAEIAIRQRRLADIFLAPLKSLKEGGIQL